MRKSAPLHRPLLAGQLRKAPHRGLVPELLQAVLETAPAEKHEMGRGPSEGRVPLLMRAADLGGVVRERDDPLAGAVRTVEMQRERLPRRTPLYAARQHDVEELVHAVRGQLAIDRLGRTRDELSVP